MAFNAIREKLNSGRNFGIYSIRACFFIFRYFIVTNEMVKITMENDKLFACQQRFFVC